MNEHTTCRGECAPELYHLQSVNGWFIQCTGCGRRGGIGFNSDRSTDLESIGRAIKYFVRDIQGVPHETVRIDRPTSRSLNPVPRFGIYGFLGSGGERDQQVGS